MKIDVHNTLATAAMKTMTYQERDIRSDIRNAFFPANAAILQSEINGRAKKAKWFEVACLMELLLETATEIAYSQGQQAPNASRDNQMHNYGRRK